MASITFEKLFESSTETQITAEPSPQDINARLTIERTDAPLFMKILVLATAIDSTEVRNGITTRLNALGYVSGTDYTLTTINVSASYTGSGDITGSTPPYNIIVLVTNSGGTSSSTFGTNLNSYVNNGFNLILMTFVWNINVASGSTFDYAANNPLTFSGNQSYDSSNITLNQSVSHPILTSGGVSLNIGADQYNGSVSLTANSTTLATFPTHNTIAVAIREKGNARLVAFNFYPGALTNPLATLQNRRNILVNGILWCGRRI